MSSSHHSRRHHTRRHHHRPSSSPHHSQPSPPPSPPSTLPLPLPSPSIGPPMVDTFLSRAHGRFESRTGRFWTSDGILAGLRGELAACERGIASVVRREFGLHRGLGVPIEARLAPADLDDRGEWYRGRGRLWRETQARVLVPSVIVRLPETWERRRPGGPGEADRWFQEAVRRVVDTLRDARWLGQYDRGVDLRGLPLDPRGDLYHCCFEFRDGPADGFHILAPLTYIYLPAVNGEGPPALYERYEKDKPGADAHWRAWLAQWNVISDRDMNMGRARSPAFEVEEE